MMFKTLISLLISSTVLASIGKNIRSLQTATTITGTVSYVTCSYYTGTTCSGTPAYVSASGVGYCGTTGSTSTQTVITGPANNLYTATASVYSATTCTGTPAATSTTTFPSTCSTDASYLTTLEAIYGSIICTSSASLPSWGTPGLLTLTYPTSTCSGSAVEGDWYLATGACQQTTPTTSATLTCSGSTYTETIYIASTTCLAGTGLGAPIPLDLTCTAVSGDNTYSIDSCLSAPSASSSDSSSSCFAGSETATLESGESISISEVRVGDKVLAADENGNTLFSEVVSVPHGPNNVLAIFTQISTESGRDIKLTPDHLISAGTCDSAASLPLVMAGDVKEGSCLQTVAGREKVATVDSAKGYGIYTFVTKEAMVVVNGIVASPFANNHAVANAFYNVHRILYAFAPALLQFGWVKQANLVFGQIVAGFSS